MPQPQSLSFSGSPRFSYSDLSPDSLPHPFPHKPRPERTKPLSTLPAALLAPIPAVTPSQTMAAADSAITTATCAHCHREIPSSNIMLHSAHCARNLQKCERCGDMIPRKLMDEHYDGNHAPVICSLCQQTVERELWDLHKGLQCPQRMLACQYCGFELPAADIFEHQDVCGNRTEYCQPCRKYIRLREWIGHEVQFHSQSNVASESSSDRSTLEEEEESYPAEEQPVRPKPAHALQCKQLLVTVAIAGIAILIGSILLKNKGWIS